MLEHLYYLINHYTASFYTVIYKSNYLFIDYWSLVHFTFGLWIVFVAYHKKYRHPFMALGAVLFSWEFLEILFIYLAIHVFKPETIPDQFTDIAIGVSGGLSGWLLWRYKEKANLLNLCRKHLTLGIELSVSCTMAFCWVGSYGYIYNVSFFNSPVINWLAFLLWSAGLFATIRVYRLFSQVVRPLWTRMILTGLAYFSGLLVLEYLGYHVFKIRQVTTEGPLLFGLIHGTVTLKLYYIIAGICAVMLSGILKRLSRGAFAPPEKNRAEKIMR